MEKGGGGGREGTAPAIKVYPLHIPGTTSRLS